MTFQFTDPLEALDFFDHSYNPTIRGNIRQSQDHRISIEAYFDNRLQPATGTWNELNQAALGEIIKILENRIQLQELINVLAKNGFVLAMEQA